MPSTPPEDNLRPDPTWEIPAHIAIIMDGNGRWARERRLPRLAGHRAGTENLRRVIRACVEFGVHYLTVYAFSTENWARPKEEVDGLMEIMEEFIDKELDELDAEGVQIRHVGKLEGVRPQLQIKIREAIERTRHNQRLVLNVAFNYGGRDEIVQAVRRIVEDGIPAEAITEETIASRLYTAGLPDPDLVIRTSGEVRISNFLLWQSAYAEWYFTPVFWPDFGRQHLLEAIADYNRRERRFGRVLDPDE